MCVCVRRERGGGGGVHVCGWVSVSVCKLLDVLSLKVDEEFGDEDRDTLSQSHQRYGVELQ